MTSIMEDFGDIAARLAQIEQEKQRERDADDKSAETCAQRYPNEPAQADQTDIWGAVYGFTPTSADCFI